MAANTPEHLDEWEVAKNYLEDTKDMTLDDFQALPEDDVLAVCTPLSLPCKGRLLKLYKANKATGKCFADGLPPLEHAVGSSSGPSKNRSHASAQVSLGKFGTLKGLELRRDDSVLWADAGKSGKLAWATESDVQGHVKNAITDAVRAAGLEDEVLILNEMSVSELRPDVWVVLKSGVPIGVVEVKKPGVDILENECVVGQMYDYLEMLHVFHGLETVFGLITTYAEWRVCWRIGSEEVAAADDLPEISAGDTSLNRSALAKSVRELLHELRQAPEEEKEEAGGLGAESSDDEGISRHVGASEVYPQAHPDLPLVLASVARKMHSSVEGCGSGLAGQPGEICVMVDEHTWTWRQLPAALQWERFPRPNTARLFLVCDFGGGADGRSWLACSSTGAVCVVKFAWEGKKEDGQFSAENERSLWHQAYGDLGKLARVRTLNGRPALIMPFVSHCEECERENEDVQAAVRAAVEKLAENGLQHVDLRWRHVGLYRNHEGAIERAVLFDIARAKAVDSSEEAISQMLAKLKIK